MVRGLEILPCEFWVPAQSWEGGGSLFPTPKVKDFKIIKTQKMFVTVTEFSEYVTFPTIAFPLLVVRLGLISPCSTSFTLPQHGTKHTKSVWLFAVYELSSQTHRYRQKCISEIFPTTWPCCHISCCHNLFFGENSASSQGCRNQLL